jgi:hypothetical protein
MFRRNYAFFAAIQCKLSVKTVACCQLRKFRVRTKQTKTLEIIKFTVPCPYGNPNIVIL